MASQLDLCNRALLSVGARTQISSVFPSDGSTEANACATLFQSTYEQLARTAPWNCFRNQVNLSLLAAAIGTPENPDGSVLPLPPAPWLYQYAYPSDCLQFRWLVPYCPNTDNSSDPPQTSINNTAPSYIPTQGQIPYAISYAASPKYNNPLITVLTNQEYATAVYTINQPNPAAWDSLFQQAFVAGLGVYLVPALSLSLPLMQMCIKTAEMAITQARVSDGNEGVTVMDHLPDWMVARTGSPGYYGTGYSNCPNGGWSDVNWPSYW